MWGPAPLPESFPVVFFDTADEDAARTWLDGLLTSEERTEGDDRSYPGAIAAHLSISLDGTKVLSLSEWLTEEQAAAHIAAVWEPVLKEFGGTGTLYRHISTAFAPDADVSPGDPRRLVTLKGARQLVTFASISQNTERLWCSAADCCRNRSMNHEPLVRRLVIDLCRRPASCCR